MDGVVQCVQEKAHPPRDQGAMLRLHENDPSQTMTVRAAHVLGGSPSGGANGVMSASTVRLAGLHMVAWKLKWLGELAGEVVLGKLTPDRAFVRFWEMQDIVAWSECRPLVECFFDAADTWQSQGRHPIATAFYGQLLRMGLCVGHDRLVVRSLKGLLDLESSEPESIPMAICPHQLKRLVSVWLADSTEQADADKGPNPGRFEWMLSRAEALRQREQRVRLMHGLDGLIAFYAAPGSGVALNLRAVLLLPRWGELAATLDEEADARLEALLRSVLVAGEQLRAVGLSSVDQLLERTFAQMWTHMSERHSYPT
ncbi:MAG: hypothetical protein AAFS10_14915 [Myxococcota bacterium]